MPENDIIEAFQILLKDEQDSIRIYLPEAFVEICRKNIQKSSIPIFIKALSEDSCWRVRLVFCDMMVEVEFCEKNKDVNRLQNSLEKKWQRNACFLHI